MLSNNPAPSPPPLEPRPSSRPVPAGALPTQVSIPDHGYVSPRQQFERRAPHTPGSPSQSSQKQPQHGLNQPRASLSPLSEYHSGYADEDLGPPYRSPSPYSLAGHRRQQSFPNLLPLAFRSRTPSPTRKTQHTRSPSEQMPYTGDGRNNGRTPESQRGGGLISWLSGSAGAANALGLHAPNGASKDGTTPPETTPTRPRRSATGASNTAASDATTPKSTMTTASRFMSALSSRFNPSTPTSPTPGDGDGDDDHAHDELYHLNIEAALFPRGSPTPDRDPFSPSAFKNLHMNATGLLAKLQTAYRAQAAALRDLRAVRSAEADEREEAETRARHLKMQLEDLARQAQERERLVQALAGELEAERRAREEAERLVAAAVASGNRPSAVPPSEGASMVSEDLGVDEDRRRRGRNRKSWKSGASCDGDTDEEEEDGNESAESESVFSRCRSPSTLPVPATQVFTAASDVPRVKDVMGTPQPGKPSGVGGGSANVTPKQKSGQQMSAFQKILKGISGEDAGANGCANCQGQDASVAWDTVSLLRDENRHLKRRVGELEGAVEGALDLVNGIGL